MSDDLVERLRNPSCELFSDWAPLMREAAAEIERLRAVMDQIHELIMGVTDV